MRKFAAVVLLGLVAVLVVPSARPVHAQTCSPRGDINGGPGGAYDWIANGGPSNNSCWNPVNTSFVTGTTTCGWTSNAWEFSYSGEISQSFTIPSGWTATHFGISYLLDFEDPTHNPAWSQFEMTVRDTNTGAVLASDSYLGSNPDLYCSYRSKLWTGNLAGHTLQVLFRGTPAGSSTHIRVRFISLTQN